MKSASDLFYLSVFALWATPSLCFVPKDACSISPKSIVEDACVSYATLEGLNARLKPAVDELTTTTDYFSHYRLNLFNKQCPFWDDTNGVCGNIACAVETLDNEEDVPLVWRASELSKLEGPRAAHPGRSAQRQHPQRPLQGELGEGVGESCVVEYEDDDETRDYCVREDEGASSKGEYVSLLRNPERFTGYGGEGAHHVWDAIYSENCFQKASFPHTANLGMSPFPQGPAVQGLRSVMANAGVDDEEEECLEKRVFYRVVSGMHASISSHLCWDFLNQTTGEWQPNSACYRSRLHEHADRISNLYFNYALVTRAIAKLDRYLQSEQYTFCTGDPDEDATTRAKVLAVTRRAASVPQLFDESIMFVNGEGPHLKEEFRNRFRNVSRTMDCVGCDKCRLWGKVQTSGYGTALKILFEARTGELIPALKRTEVVALFNTHARLSSSLAAVARFRAMVAAEDGEEELFGPYGDEPSDEDRLVAEFVRLKKTKPSDDGGLAVFQLELKRFQLALRIVLNRWLRVPKTFWNIFTSESKRLFQFWIGLPVAQRRWKFGFPDLNPAANRPHPGPHPHAQPHAEL